MFSHLPSDCFNITTRFCRVKVHLSLFYSPKSCFIGKQEQQAALLQTAFVYSLVWFLKFQYILSTEKFKKPKKI